MCDIILTPDDAIDTVQDLMDALPEPKVVWKQGEAAPPTTDVCLCSVDIPRTLQGHGIPYSWNFDEWAFGYVSPWELRLWKHSQSA